MPQERARRALWTCLENCYTASDPFAYLQRCVDDLRQNPTWNAAEIEEPLKLGMQTGHRIIGGKACF